MKIVYGKTLSDDESKIVSSISERCGIKFDTARLLFYRGINSVEDAKNFLNPNKEKLFDPFLLNGMKETVERIKKAKERRENILVFGDYDADGISAASTLYFCLKEFGINTRVTVPERIDGYGLNIEKIKALNQEEKIHLIITVDCGISECESIDKIKALGIDVIVTDHHEPPEILPNCISINPKIKGQSYPFDALCGAGVAYKLGYALIGEKANEYLDLTALATVADSMDLIGENRVIVSQGLKILNSNKQKYFFKCLLSDSQRAITSQTLAFIIAPRVNAGGRMGDANTALKMFISKDKNEILDLAVKLNKYNIERQVGCDEIYKKAKEIIKNNDLASKEVILVADSGWSTGYIGIVASRLVEDYNKPVIVFAENEGMLKGSARSVGDINIFDAINYSSDILGAFGGHAQAAGVSVSKENFPVFCEKVCEYVKNRYGVYCEEKTVFVDWKIDKAVDIEFAKEIEKLEPFGVGNRKPLFSVKVNEVNSSVIKSGSLHYTFNTEFLSFLDFNGANDVFLLSLPIEKEIVFELNYSVFKGKESVKGILKNIIPHFNGKDLSLYVFDKEVKRLANDNFVSTFLAEKPKIKEGFGTVYFASNIETVKQYDLPKNMEVYYFSPPEKKPKNCLIISPDFIPDCFNNACYLDKPVIFNNFGIKTECFDKIDGGIYFKDLSCDREIFTKVYENLVNCEGKKYYNYIQIFKTEINGVNDKQFIFCAEVFNELGIFYFENGIFKRNSKIKNSLINSKIYQNISSLKKPC